MHKPGRGLVPAIFCMAYEVYEVARTPIRSLHLPDRSARVPCTAARRRLAVTAMHAGMPDVRKYKVSVLAGGSSTRKQPVKSTYMAVCLRAAPARAPACPAARPPARRRATPRPAQPAATARRADPEPRPHYTLRIAVDRDHGRRRRKRKAGMKAAAAPAGPIATVRGKAAGLLPPPFIIKPACITGYRFELRRRSHG